MECWNPVRLAVILSAYVEAKILTPLAHIIALVVGSRKTCHENTSSNLFESPHVSCNMRLSFAAGLLLLLTTASAFGTVQPPNYSISKSTLVPSTVPAFVRGGKQLHASTSSVDETTIVSSENLALLSERGRMAIKLLESDEAQRHVVADWPEPGTEDDGKIQLAEQVSSLA